MRSASWLLSTLLLALLAGCGSFRADEPATLGSIEAPRPAQPLPIPAPGPAYQQAVPAPSGAGAASTGSKGRPTAVPSGANVSAPAPATAAVGGAPAAAGAQASTGGQEVAEAPVDPATRKAFDDARLAMLTGHADAAEKALLAIAAQHPDFGGPPANLGILYRQAGRLEDSAAQLEKATQLGPHQPSYFNELGITYRSQGAFAKAQAAYEQAISVDPNFAAAVLNLAILYDLYLWDPAKAQGYYERYLTLVPDGDEQVGKWLADLKNRLRAAKKKEAQ